MMKTLIMAGALVALLSPFASNDAHAVTARPLCGLDSVNAALENSNAVAGCFEGVGDLGGLDAVNTDGPLETPIFGVAEWYKVPNSNPASRPLVFGVRQSTVENPGGAIFTLGGLSGKQQALLVFSPVDSNLDPAPESATGLFDYVAYLITEDQWGSQLAQNGFFRIEIENPFAFDDQGSTKSLAFNTHVFVTPLPAALPLMASGLAALGFLARRRRRAA